MRQVSPQEYADYVSQNELCVWSAVDGADVMMLWVFKYPGVYTHVCVIRYKGPFTKDGDFFYSEKHEVLFEEKLRPEAPLAISAEEWRSRYVPVGGRVVASWVAGNDVCAVFNERRGTKQTIYHYSGPFTKAPNEAGDVYPHSDVEVIKEMN